MDVKKLSLEERGGGRSAGGGTIFTPPRIDSPTEALNLAKARQVFSPARIAKRTPSSWPDRKWAPRVAQHLPAM